MRKKVIIINFCKNCNKPLNEKQIKKKNIFCSKGCATSFRQKAHDPNPENLNNKDLLFYILGLIWSDGNLSKEEDRISITLNDYDLIKKIFPYFSDTQKRKIYSYKKSNTIINSNIDFVNFCKNLNLIPNKSKTVTFPPIPSKYYNSFIRGIFDGDGSVYIQNTYKEKKYIGVTILSANKNFLLEIQKILKNNKIENNIILDCRESVFCLKIYKQQSIMNFYNYIYSNTDYYLQRKKDKFLIKDIV